MIESEVTQYIKTNWAKIFKYAELLGFEYPIYGCVSRDPIGYADFAFTRSGKRYIAEVKKQMDGKQAFWDAMKVLAYSKSMELADKKDTKPVIVLHRNNITYDLLPVMYCLGISYITYDDFLEFSVNL